MAITILFMTQLGLNRLLTVDRDRRPVSQSLIEAQVSDSGAYRAQQSTRRRQLSKWLDPQLSLNQSSIFFFDNSAGFEPTNQQPILFGVAAESG